MNDDGSMAKGKQLMQFAKKHNLKLGKIDDLIAYRLNREKLIKFKKSSRLSKLKNKIIKLKFLKIC